MSASDVITTLLGSFSVNTLAVSVVIKLSNNVYNFKVNTDKSLYMTKFIISKFICNIFHT
jgi:hypothetical protein